MKFNIKLFVLVGVFVGLCDVWGTEDVKNKDYDVFIVGKWTGDQKKEVKDAMADRRVIKAVYKTEYGGDVFIINGSFQNKLSKVLVCAGGGKEDGVKEVDNFGANPAGRIYYNMEKNVEYTVYFIFKKECFDEGAAEKLLNSTASMFKWCIGLIHADLSKFNTKNVKNMPGMFDRCTALKDLNLSNFNTSKVTDMSNMFCLCSSLLTLDLSSFKTTNVTDMSWMFFKCSALKDLNLRYFNTTNVTNMSFMFSNCSSLTKLDLSKFNTKKVTNMYHMFYSCTALKELNLGNFDFHNVDNIGDMFLWCKFDNLCLPNTREKRWCCCDRYVHLKGEVVVKLNQNNGEFEVVKDDPVSNNTPNLL